MIFVMKLFVGILFVVYMLSLISCYASIFQMSNQTQINRWNTN